MNGWHIASLKCASLQFSWLETWDPLSHLLIVVVMEALSRMLSTTTDRRPLSGF
jgi:hypothetical protein